MQRIGQRWAVLFDIANKLADRLRRKAAVKRSLGLSPRSFETALQAPPQDEGEMTIRFIEEQDRRSVSKDGWRSRFLARIGIDDKRRPARPVRGTLSGASKGLEPKAA